MKVSQLLKTFSPLLPIVFAANTSYSKIMPLKTQKDKVSYAIGQQIGTSLKKQGAETINLDVMFQSIRQSFNGEKSQMTPEETRATMMEMQKQMQAKMKKDAEANKAKGTKFLASNKNKKGVKTTKSGLQYKIITKGKGPKPSPTQKVKVHYKGTLTDGTVFDSSYERGQPAEFPVNGVIKGWQEALTLMPVGSKWQLTIPSDLAYGPRGNPRIPAHSVLLFDVELLEIVASKDTKKKKN